MPEDKKNRENGKMDKFLDGQTQTQIDEQQQKTKIYILLYIQKKKMKYTRIKMYYLFLESFIYLINQIYYKNSHNETFST